MLIEKLKNCYEGFDLTLAPNDYVEAKGINLTAVVRRFSKLHLSKLSVSCYGNNYTYLI